jgi:DNA-binding HxlR family transcriptional regulator
MARMTTKRSYHDACGMAHALDLVGERWALLVVRELLLGPKRYSDLLADLPGISTNVLSHRLTELERSGVLGKRRLPPPAASQVYELTEWGRELEPVIRLIGRWGARSPVHPRDARLSVTSLIISLRTNFTPDAVPGLRGRYELHIGEDRFLAEVDEAGLHVDRTGRADSTHNTDNTHNTHSTGRQPAAAHTPDAVITAGVPQLAGTIYGPRPLAEAVRSGDVAVSGDLRAAERFLSGFTLPETAVADRS